VYLAVIFAMALASGALIGGSLVALRDPYRR
jgi:hypothetical protein